MTEFIIGKTKVGGENPCFIVAEIGINFDGKYSQALSLIDAAAKAGCNAVKFQLFRAERMYPRNAGKWKAPTGRKEDIIGIIEKGELSYSWVPKLRNYAKKLGLEFFASVCDEKSADMLEKHKGDAFKITSYEITHLPLIKHIAEKNKPIIFSCGGASLSEIKETMDTINKQGNRKIALLHCIAQYPAPLNNLNLKIIQTLKTVFPEAIIGYSDHSSSPIEAPRAAVALGAKIIEKHITLDRNLPGPDHSFALNPNELSLMVKIIRQTEKELKQGRKIKISPILLGTSERKTYEEEKWVRNFTYRCVIAIKGIKKGEPFTKRNIAVLRPGEVERGIEPKYYSKVNEYVATKNINKYSPIHWWDLKKDSNNPEITVIIRTYNSDKFVASAIESVLGQTIKSKLYEILVVDDGSNDKTKEIINRYKGIIKIVSQKHKGAIVALNKGLKEAKGRYVTILDSDDLFEPDILAKMFDVFKKNKKIDFVYCDYKEMTMDGNIKTISLSKNIFNGVAVGFMFKKEILKSVGGYDEKLIFPEYDLIIKITGKYKGHHIPVPLFIYMRHNQSLTHSKKYVEQGKNQLFLKYNQKFNIRDY